MTIKRAAILGAGVMGAQIAALFITAGIKTYLFDLSKTIVLGSLEALPYLKPTPLGIAIDAYSIIPADYDNDLHALADCDFIIEAISDRIDYKLSLYNKIAPYIRAQTVLATNTAGLSINSLAKALDSRLQAKFCGVHFFNPPRYMKLVEIIPNEHMNLGLLPNLETFLVHALGKGVIYAKDTPGFIGNRIGLFSMLTAIHHAKAFNLTPDIIDVLMGPKIGRAKSAIFRTLDIVGLDVFRQAIVTLHKSLPEDPWRAYFCVPHWIESLIDKGALGQKTRMGIYKKDADEILVYQSQAHGYRPAKFKIDPQVSLILAIKNPQTRIEALRICQSSQAQFLWACFRDLFHYVAYHFNDVAQDPQDIDLALRWGYSWQEGPFEIWQKAGWAVIRQAIEQDIDCGKTMSSAQLPVWTQKDEGVYTDSELKAIKTHRQSSMPANFINAFEEGNILFETPAIRLWCHDKDSIPILSFKTKKNIITESVLDGFLEALDRVERDYKALVICQQQGTDFSLGANLKAIYECIAKEQYGPLESLIRKYQHTAMRIKYSTVPVVMALSGRVVNSGLEWALHARSSVASLETYMGFVETGIGLLPFGGGCKELVLKGPQYIRQYFDQIMRKEVSCSAQEAKLKGYLSSENTVVMNAQEILYFAKKQAAYLAEDLYYPPIKRQFLVAGSAGLKRLQSKGGVLFEGNKMRDHEYFIAMQLAKVLCGGFVQKETLANEQMILDLECEAFINLVKTDETQARIKHKLERGHTLKN